VRWHWGEWAMKEPARGAAVMLLMSILPGCSLGIQSGKRNIDGEFISTQNVKSPGKEDYNRAMEGFIGGEKPDVTVRGSSSHGKKSGRNHRFRPYAWKDHLLLSC